MKKLLCLLAALLLTSAPGRAEEVGASLDAEILVTATRLTRELAHTGSSVTVIQGRTLREGQVRLLRDGLALVPGSFVAGGVPGAASSLFLRGAPSNSVVVLVDGVQVNDPTIGGQYNLFDLGALDVERIEVLRGAASALYGSDAAGGVLNVVTRPGHGAPTVRILGEGGSHGHALGTISVTGDLGPWTFRLGAGRHHTRNDLRQNGFTDDTFSGRLGVDLGVGFRLAGTAHHVASVSEDPWDFPFGPQIEKDPNIERSRKTALFGLRLAQDARDWLRWEVSGTFHRARSRLENGPDRAGDPPELSSRTEAVVRNLTGTVVLDLPGVADDLGLRALLGVEAEDERTASRLATSFGPSPDIDDTIRNRAGFLVLEATAWERLSVSGGLRRDRNSFAGWETNASASLLYRLDSTGTRLRGNYGEAFRAPKPVEFADPFVGNPDLHSESSVSLDVGVEQEFLDGDLLLATTWFQTRTRDLITYDFDTFRLENFSRARTRGWELSAAARPLPDLTLRAVWTAQDPRNLSAEPGTEKRLPSRPRWYGGGEVSWRRGDVLLGGEIRTSGDWPDSGKITPDGDLRRHPGRKLLVSVRGRYEVSENVALFARIENLLDRDWYDSEVAPSGLGRAFYLGFSAEF